ncbi:MAG: hypothetical protein SFW66_10930 [Gammaproteobacteria bacterium]|nr:hypothetical protein [Gammaproteobacteria bacterium]
MNNEHCAIPGHKMHYLKRLSWTAVIIGALVGVGISFLLNLFSVAIGLSIVKTTNQGMMSLAIGGFIGLLISTIVSMFTAGYTAGYLGYSDCNKRHLGVLYGFAAWCVGLILMAMFATHITRYVSYYEGFVTHHPAAIALNKDRTPQTMQSSDSAQSLSDMQSSDTSQPLVNSQKETNDLGISMLFIFALFFVGALSSCFGGHYGMEYCEKCCAKKNRPSESGFPHV